MLTRFADLGIRHPRRILATAALLFLLAALYGASAAGHLSSGGFRDPHSASSQVDDLLQKTFHAGQSNLVLEVTSAQGASSSAARQAGLAAVAAIRKSPYADQVSSYWSVPAAQARGLVSRDGRSALVVASIAGSDSEAPKRAADISKPLAGTHGAVTVRAGGFGNAFDQVNDQTKKDLATAEMITIPLTVIALIWVFGSLLASLLPLVVGLFAIVGTMASLRGLAMLTDVSTYSLNMTTAMGLALAIDYSLFVVSRYREEIRRGVAPDAAVRRTMQTAGRTVLFSALTVGLSLAAMLVFPVYFLRSFAYAGIAVVALATVAALVLLPAMLTLMGTRVDALDLRVFVRRLLRRPAPVVKPVELGFWYRFARGVMKRALPVGLLVTAVLVGLGLPFLHAQFAYPDDRVLPHSASAHQVGDDVRGVFSSNAGSTVTIAAKDVSSAPTAIGGYAAELSRLDHVSSVSSAAGVYVDGREVAPTTGQQVGDATYLAVRIDVEAQSAAGKALLNSVESVPAPWRVLYGGQTAVNRDSLHALGSAMPYALILIALATFIVLFLFTGSVVLPLKALVLNTLSLSATFGAMVWVFQYGHLGFLFNDLTTTGTLVPTMPPLMFCLAFGLSMDYEVFLLSRIREAWLESDRSAGASVEAVAQGLGRTGRIVTAAALLMAIVFAGMAGSTVSFMMLFGAGLTLAVLMDATVVRGILVPAFMRLAGRWNWWAPKPLARLHARVGLSEGPSVPDTIESLQELTSTR
ncbi:MAG TPA: MMPL family transporter [Jatrophihabitans sp.]|jgi:RND superfamily putative drug exporter|uniref:MMPL family transporter n=1 Tax=Jatrophihabitans sp. TaxID=1932789 RepID=UPI002E0C49C7|nr:MMPL family transporter [Jatrophihabitans sp.]